MNLFFSNIMTSYFLTQPVKPVEVVDKCRSEKKEARSLDELIKESNDIDKKINELLNKIDKLDDDFNRSLLVRIISVFFDVRVSKRQKCSLPSIPATSRKRFSDLIVEPDQSVLEKIGYGIANPGINICYVNSVLQALRMSQLFMKFMSGSYDRIQEERKGLPALAEDLIKIAELLPKERNEAWTTLIRAKESYSKILQNRLFFYLNTLPENTKKYLTIYGYREVNKKAILSYLEKPGKDISPLKIQPYLRPLVLRLEQASHLNKPVEVLKKDLGEIFNYIKGPEYIDTVDRLIDIQQKAKEESALQVQQVLAPGRKAFGKLMHLSQVHRQEFVRYPLIIQLKKLYETIEGADSQKAATFDKEGVQAIRQLARFGGFEATKETSQEDAFSFLGHLLDTMQTGLFGFSSHARGNEKGHSFALGLGDGLEKSDMQTIISKIDCHSFTTEEEAPDFLPIQLKRYDNVGKKNKKRIDPSLALQISTKEDPEKRVKYHLTAVVVHQGEFPQLGHYFTFAPKVLGEKQVWVEYNDSRVSIYKCAHDKPPDVILENGYLFLYEKEAVVL